MKRIISSFSHSGHNVSLTKTPTFLKIIILFFISLFLFILVRRFSPDITSLVVPTTTPSQKFPMSFTPAVVAGKNPPPAPADLRHTVVERTGIIDENGAMTNDFIVGEFDEELIDSVVNNGKINGSDEGLVSDVNRGVLKGKIGKFGVCDESMRDYVPCLDNVEGKGETLKGKGLNCLVPRPKDYKLKIPWPKSRDEIWFSNVPCTPFAKDKAGYKWVKRKGDKYIFPGDGANQHSDQISKMVSEIAFGRRTRVAMDINCGIASFGTYLMDRNVSTLSIATKDVHSNQVQFALERGVPAMLAAFTTHRLLFPSQAFDLIHCSRCSINWTRDDGILLLEVNRMLRAGGYFICAAEPVAPFKEMEDLTQRLCWELLKKEGDISIWRKPLNNSCYLSRAPAVQPSLCDAGDDPDNVWNVNLKNCITQLPENGYGANMTAWPARLHSPPNRLFSIKMDAELSRREIFKESRAETSSEPAPPPNKSAVPVNKTNFPCYFYFNGYCNKGERCSYLHGPDDGTTTWKSSKIASGVPDGLTAEKKTSAGSETGPSAVEKHPDSSETGPKAAACEYVKSKVDLHLTTNNVGEQIASHETSGSPSEEATAVRLDSLVPAECFSQGESDLSPNQSSDEEVEDNVEREELLESSPGFDVLVDDRVEGLGHEDDHQYMPHHDMEDRELDERFAGYDFENSLEYDPSYPDMRIASDQEQDGSYYNVENHEINEHVREIPIPAHGRQNVPHKRRLSREMPFRGRGNVDLRDLLKRRRGNESDPPNHLSRRFDLSRSNAREQSRIGIVVHRVPRGCLKDWLQKWKATFLSPPALWRVLNI